MQSLAAGVGDLKKVLANVKTRGVMGEVQLAALLEQILTPEQYETNVATRPGSRERVEFAIKLPGHDPDTGTVWLPIDAKFPLEDYQRLQDAREAADPAAMEAAAKARQVRAAVKSEFGKFAEVLASTKRQLQAVANSIDQAETRTRQIERKLKDVEALPEPEEQPAANVVRLPQE